MLLSLLCGASCLAPLLSYLLPIPMPWMHHSEQKQVQAPRTLIASQEGLGPHVSLQMSARGAAPRRCGNGEDAPHVATRPCANWLPSSVKPQPSAFQQKKMFFKNCICLGWTRRLLSLVDIKGACIWKHTLLWNQPWKQWSLLSSLIFRLGYGTEYWFLWLHS